VYYARKRDVIELEQPAKIGPTIPLVEVQIGWYPGTARFPAVLDYTGHTRYFLTGT